MISHLVVGGCLLLIYAAIVMVAAPVAVSRRRWTSALPRTAITVWAGALGSGVIAMLTSFVCAIAAASTLATRPRAPLSLHSALSGIGLTLTACLMTAVGGGLLCVAVYRLAVAAVDRHRLHQDVSAAFGPSHAWTDTVVVDSDAASAISLGGRHPLILVSSLLAGRLTPDELEAVVEHERGHLAQRHHTLLQVADLQYRCAPALPCAQALERSLHLLVELAADDHAARRCGVAVTASALRALASVTSEDGFALRARRLERRLASPVPEASHG